MSRCTSSTMSDQTDVEKWLEANDILEYLPNFKAAKWKMGNIRFLRDEDEIEEFTKDVLRIDVTYHQRRVIAVLVTLRQEDLRKKKRSRDEYQEEGVPVIRVSNVRN